MAAAGAAADLLTKHMIFQRLPESLSAPVVIVKGFIQFIHGENRGGVFGLGQGSALWLVFGLVAGVLVVWFAHREDTKPILVQIALGLVLAGAVGNVFDRVVFGHVRDFIDVCYWPGRHWPAFNVADSGICVGAVYLALHAFFTSPKTGKDSTKARKG